MFCFEECLEEFEIEDISSEDDAVVKDGADLRGREDDEDVNERELFKGLLLLVFCKEPLTGSTNLTDAGDAGVETAEFTVLGVGGSEGIEFKVGVVGGFKEPRTSPGFCFLKS